MAQPVMPWPPGVPDQSPAARSWTYSKPPDPRADHAAQHDFADSPQPHLDGAQSRRMREAGGNDEGRRDRRLSPHGLDPVRGFAERLSRGFSARWGAEPDGQHDADSFDANPVTARESGACARRTATQVYAQIRPQELKRSVSFYETRALGALTT